MAVWHYDNLEPTPVDGEPGFVEFERIFVFDWNRFDEADWQRLSRIYEGLPGWLRFAEMPWWFGDDESSPPFLSASMEPSGLQVYGMLPLSVWLGWDERFRHEIRSLPALLSADPEDV